MTAATWRSTGTRWLKFNLVGGIGVGVQLLVLGTLRTGFQVDYLVATALAVEAAVVNNFFWHERFTWADRTAKSRLMRFIKFNLTTGLVSILGNVALMKMFAGIFHMQYLVANLTTIAACSLVNFAVSDRFVFRSHLQLERKC